LKFIKYVVYNEIFSCDQPCHCGVGVLCLRDCLAPSSGINVMITLVSDVSEIASVRMETEIVSETSDTTSTLTQLIA
jgi:hypothetical protein